MAIADKLTQLNNVKLAIKNAIINKGIDMTGVAFTSYATKINEISSKVLYNSCKTRNGGQASAISHATDKLSSKGSKVLVSFAGYNDGSDSRASGNVIVYGSNDGTTWTTLGTLSGFTLSQNKYNSVNATYSGKYYYYKTSDYKPNFVSYAISLVVIG